jgi:diadenosine tetraphosphatase ApaH/serine/threonine PP2A family protein phosphatase
VHIGSDEFDWLESLPTELRVSFDATSVILRHASPWDEETYLYPDSERVTEIALERWEVLVLGHTHWPMVRRAGGGQVVNPGSVGQPRDYNPKAAFAVLDSGSGSVVHHRVDYDVAGYALRLVQMGWEPGPVAILSREKGDVESGSKTASSEQRVRVGQHAEHPTERPSGLLDQSNCRQTNE